MTRGLQAVSSMCQQLVLWLYFMTYSSCRNGKWSCTDLCRNCVQAVGHWLPISNSRRTWGATPNRYKSPVQDQTTNASLLTVILDVKCGPSSEKTMGQRQHVAQARTIRLIFPESPICTTPIDDARDKKSIHFLYSQTHTMGLFQTLKRTEPRNPFFRLRPLSREQSKKPSPQKTRIISFKALTDIRNRIQIHAMKSIRFATTLINVGRRPTAERGHRKNHMALAPERQNFDLHEKQINRRLPITGKICRWCPARPGRPAERSHVTPCGWGMVGGRVESTMVVLTVSQQAESDFDTSMIWGDV